MAVIGYARVSTEDQSAESQVAELSEAGAATVVVEYASGGNKKRPELNAIVRKLRAGDVLLVVRLDRLARSVSHLLDVIETLKQKGAHFKSLRDPIDTSSPQGMFTLQVLAAAAELEKSLIQERTKAGLAVSRLQGRVGGNPRFKARDPEAFREMSATKRATFLSSLINSESYWLPVVKRLRPQTPWPDVVAIINVSLKEVDHWTVDRLKRAVKAYVREGFLTDRVLKKAKPKPRSENLTSVVAALYSADPKMTLAEAADKLMRLREVTPRGGQRWATSTVAMLRDRAIKQGLLL